MPVRLPQLAADAAFFIDFDGTLVAIALRPDLVEVEPRVKRVLETLAARSGGALAIVTGRSIDVVDAFLAPLKLPTAAEHGSIRRDANGNVHEDTRAAAEIAVAAERLRPLVIDNPDLLIERKKSSVALHYRQRPELAEICAAAIKEAAAGLSGLVILPGKTVYELRPEGVDKGGAVKAFLDEPPFRGRLPIYAGDDTTDEHAFAVVNDAGGMSIKIGEGETAARYRTDREGLVAWLEALVRS
jgi:trehalose 6-phosphate phosphatase